MKNTLHSSISTPTQTPRSRLGSSPLLDRLTRIGAISALAVLAACSDSDGKYTPGSQADAGVSSTDGGMTADGGNSGTEVSSSSFDSGTTNDATSVDSSVSGTDATVATEVTAADTTTVDSVVEVASTADTAVAETAAADIPKPSAPETSPDAAPVKITKSAPADQYLSEFKPGMVIPTDTVFILKDKKTGKIVTDMPFTAYEGFGYKNGVTQLQSTKVAGVAEGVNVYPFQMKNLPQDMNVAGKGNIHVIAFNLPEGVNVNHPQGVESGSWIDALTGKKAQDGVTPLYTHAAILPIVCADGAYANDDAQLMTQAVTSISTIEFNHNLPELIDTLNSNLQGKINALFGAAGKGYAPICKIGPIVPGDAKILDVQNCPKGCMYLQVSVLPIASWTELIQK